MIMGYVKCDTGDLFFCYTSWTRRGQRKVNQ